MLLTAEGNAPAPSLKSVLCMIFLLLFFFSLFQLLSETVSFPLDLTVLAAASCFQEHNGDTADMVLGIC